MGKMKPHKGLAKRIRISKSGKVRHRSAFHKHLSSHKSGKRLRHLRQDPQVASCETKRFEKMLFRRLRGRNQAVATRRRSPSPEERRAAREGAKSE
ncbi:MAG: 50S ribosomal protein L35 [Phycisphaerales bacterium JB059]|jgi:large subunit ribosomal protein L35